MIEQLFAITKNTFLESIRQPIFSVLLIVASLVLFLNPAVASYTMDDDNKLMVDMGLSTLFVAGLLLAAFTATGVLSTEVENRTVLTVISKPIPRPLFVLGKYLGVTLALAVGFWSLTLFFLLTVRHGVMQRATDTIDPVVMLFGFLAWFFAIGMAAFGNYYYRWVFTSSFVKILACTLTAAFILMLLINRQWHFQSLAHEWSKDGSFAQGRLPMVILLIFQAILVLTALAIAASTRLGQLLTLLICCGAFLLGLASQTTLSPQAISLQWSQLEGFLQHIGWLLARLTYYVLPNLQFFWLADTLPQKLAIPAGHLGLLSLYAGLQITALLCLAIALFQSREVG